jgi:two-component system CheB/CheR fusion protein
LGGLTKATFDGVMVVAQHLSPSSPSRLVALLARETDLPVSEIVDGQAMVSGHIYVAPPDVDVTVETGKLLLVPTLTPHGPKPSIDRLFTSLAMAYGEQAVGIVLSGNGRDGAEGAQIMFQEGGTVLVQQPDSAQHASMPLATLEIEGIATVLPPSELGRYLLARIALDCYQIPQALVMEDAADNELQQLMQGIHQHLGVDVSQYKTATFHRRIPKRLIELSKPNLTAYLSYLQDHPEEWHTLFHTLLIGVTSFFRDPEVFDRLTPILEELIANKRPHESLRVWVPGCATGEEAYSIAIAIYQILRRKNQRHLKVQIFATDVNEQSILKARSGYFATESLQSLDPTWAKECFVPHGQGHQVIKSIRSMLLFSRHDLVQHPPFLNLDLISCRNLLIYFTPELQHQVMLTFHYALRPSAYLLLGRSEHIGEFHLLFEPIDASTKLFRRLRGQHFRHMQMTGLQPMLAYPSAPLPRQKIPPSRDSQVWEIYG